jgi:hypothetical protein
MLWLIFIQCVVQSSSNVEHLSGPFEHYTTAIATEHLRYTPTKDRVRSNLLQLSFSDLPQ